MSSLIEYLKKWINNGSIEYIKSYMVGRRSKNSKKEKDGVIRFHVPWRRWIILLPLLDSIFFSMGLFLC